MKPPIDGASLTAGSSSATRASSKCTVSFVRRSMLGAKYTRSVKAIYAQHKRVFQNASRLHRASRPMTAWKAQQIMGCDHLRDVTLAAQFLGLKFIFKRKKNGNHHPKPRRGDEPPASDRQHA